MLRLKRKYKLYNVYSRLAGPVPLSEPYIVFFLHYQPEATTLPRGYAYVQQWLAVRALASVLPAGCKLVVKEHPSIFLNNITETTRDASFYKAMVGLPQVILASLNADPFDLADKSLAVVTLTGSAGFEALCRNRPVLVFGAAAYRECPGVFFVNNIAQISVALKEILTGRVSSTTEELYHYLQWVERNSVEGPHTTDDSDPHDMVDRFDAKLIIWERLIRINHEPSAVSYGDYIGIDISLNNESIVRV